MIGRRLSNYQINERLGEGGMGTVYKATDVSLRRTVAIKMLHPFLVSNSNSLKRFKNEAYLSAKISHPNVATLFDFQEVDNCHFIVMEYVGGKALDEILQVQERIPCNEAIKITLQVLDGLGEAHDLGILHRDLKPGNVMVTEKGFAKLMDFGIARIENTERMTRQNSVIGTLDYMAPELVKRISHSKESDLYAVGVMLYEMISGKTLHAGNSEAALMYQIAHKQANINLKGYDRNVLNAIKKLTHKNSAKRYKSTQEVIRDLERVQQGGKVNTQLLSEKKLEIETQNTAPSFLAKLGNTTMEAVANLPSIATISSHVTISTILQFKIPFNTNTKIFAGALILCLMIIVIGLSSSSSSRSGNTSLSKAKIDTRQTQYESQEISQKLIADNTLVPLKSKKQIEFIEKFDDQKEEEKKEENRKSSVPVVKKKNTTKKAEKKSESTKKKKSSTAESIAGSDKKASRETPEKEVQSPATKITERKSIVDESPSKTIKLWIPDMFISANLSEYISTEKNHQGEIVYLTTTAPVFQGDHLVIPIGAKVKAVIQKLRKSTGRKRAFLSIALLSVQAINGSWLEVVYPEYSNLQKNLVEFHKGSRFNKIKLKSTTLTIKI
jgi:serine/threonine-protein kinase